MKVQDVSPAASFETNPSMDRSVLALEGSTVPAPSSPTIALSAITKTATRKRRNTARMSSPENQLPTLPAQQYHSDEEVRIRNDTKLLTQEKDANISSYQVNHLHLQSPIQPFRHRVITDTKVTGSNCKLGSSSSAC